MKRLAIPVSHLETGWSSANRHQPNRHDFHNGVDLIGHLANRHLTTPAQEILELASSLAR
jgi:hypothetical protein